jgi:hypothetical protein
MTTAAWILRPGLIEDLGCDTPETLATKISYRFNAHLTEALNGSVAPDHDLLAALMRTWPILPREYFATRDTTRPSS